MSSMSTAANDLCTALLNLPEGLGSTFALLVDVDGETRFEGYSGTLPGSNQVVGAETPLLSWSMAKSITHLLVGFAHDDGLLDVEAPAPVAEWAADERSKITIRHLLQMTSGLRWNEAYTPDGPSDVVEMLFRTGQHDVGGYAAQSGLVAEPGTTWLYSSGTTNILCRILRDVLRSASTDTVSYLNERLLVPAGIRPITDSQCRIDASGTWVGSTFLYLRGSEWLRLGRLMLDGGICDGRQIVAPRWVDEAQTEGAVPTGEPYRYSNHWWLWPSSSATPDAFAAFGYEGQHVVMVPSKNAVVVRLGATPDEHKPFVRAMIHRIIEEL